MKKTLIMLVAIALAIMGIASGEAYAATATAGPYTVNASIPTGTLVLSAGMARVFSKFTDDNGVDDDWVRNVAVMSFFELKHYLGAGGTSGAEAGLWYSPYYYPVFLGVISTSGRPFTIKSTSPTGGLSGPGGKLPKAWGVTYAKCWREITDIGGNVISGEEKSCEGGAIQGSALGPADVDRVIYVGNPSTGKSDLVRMDYAIPPMKAGGVDPFTGFVKIPLTQQGGAYSGSVTITVTD